MAVSPVSDAAKPEPARPNRRPQVAAVIAALASYVVSVTILLLILNRIFGSLSRDSFGGAALLWATYLLPALVAPAAGAVFNAVVYGEGGKRAAYWPNLALIALSTVIAVAWLLIAGGFWNAILALIQFASGLAAWFLLHKTAHGRARSLTRKGSDAQPR